MGDSTTELAREIVNQVLEDSIFKSSKPAVSSNGAVETPNKTQEGDASEEPTAMPSSVNKGKQKSVEPEQRMSEEISKEIPPQKPPTRAPSPLPAPPAAYAVKTIQVDVGAGSFPCPILVQNENGPCPLLALCNILLLRRQIRIPAGRDSIAHNDLVGLLGDAILNQMHSNPIQVEYANILDLIPSLVKGLDVNLKFDSPFSFETCPAMDLFDLFDVKLCHGWTVDPQDKETYRVVVKEKGSFNQVQEALVAGDIAGNLTSDLSQMSPDAKQEKEKALHEALICSEFLHTTASQLTSHGLISLLESLPPKSLSILFRNNHFSVLYKRGGGVTGEHEELYTLVTDDGYAKTPEIVWENLRYAPPVTFLGFNLSGESTAPPQNEDTDLALALSLQEQENERFQPPQRQVVEPQSETPGTRRKKISENLKKGAECSLM